MNADLSTLLVLASVPAIALVAAVQAVHAVRKARRHHTRANKRFLAAYRAGYQAAARAHDRRTTVVAPSPTRALPVVRPRLPTDAGDSRPLPYDVRPAAEKARTGAVTRVAPAGFIGWFGR